MDNLVQSFDEQFYIIQRGIEKIIEIEELKQKILFSIKDNKPLIVKLGVDPTAQELHLGHTVVLRKLKHFQQLGHKVFFLIGDFTARIGDPTGRDKSRPPLSEDQIIKNIETYQLQLSKILDIGNLNIVYNSSWLKNLTLENIIHLTSYITMSRLLEHNTFKIRFEHAESIRFNELLYPFLQAYDSVALKADVELGGTDQTFNLVFGRDIQKIFGQVPQVCITMPILVGTDGKNKMSKSLGNYIGINEPPYIMFEKLMRMVDDNIIPYLTLLTDKPNNEIQKIENIIKDNPSTESIIKYKKELAFTIVENFHGLEEAKKALESYGNQTKIGVFKLEIPIGELDENDNISLIRLIMLSGKASSKSEARRLVQQGAVYINNIRIDNTEQLIKADKQITLRIGKSFLAEIQWGNKNE